MSAALLILAENHAKLKRIMQTLEQAGYRCATVASGERAAAFLRQRVVDLVFLDVPPPAGAGKEVVPAVPSIAASGVLPVLRATPRAITGRQWRKSGPPV